MNITKAITKLEKLGATIKQGNQVVYASMEGKRTIEVSHNSDGECVIFAVIHSYDNGSQEYKRFFRDNLTAIIRAAGW